MMQC
jgi:NAD(P)-dependent dehydrogenase (short-subunit alcohol dehydrogenase family)